MIYGFAFLVAFALVFALIPALTKLAARLDFTDKPTERKRHSVPIPFAGGVAMFIAFSVGFIIFVVFMSPPAYAQAGDLLGATGIAAVLGGTTLIVGIGLLDDFAKTRGKEFPVWPRIAVHIGAAALAFAAGIRFTGFFNPFTDSYVELHIAIQFALTMLWFVGLVTVFNFMDGLDGLSGLLALLSGCTLFVVAMTMSQSDSAFMAALFVGAVVGFLRYNLPPAKVFMGDAGAYMLGYLLAAISLHGAFKQATVISVFIPILAMGVPIFDSVLVVARRLIARKPAHMADSSDITHIHYRLLKKGMKPAHAVAVIFLLSACLNLTSIIIMLLI